MKLTLAGVITGTFMILFSCSIKHKITEDQQFKDKINSLVSQMTLEEKVGMIHGNSLFTSAGVKRLGIPGFVMSDGPHGVRMEQTGVWRDTLHNSDDASTYLPVGICLASTWNPELGYQSGSVLGSEARYRGKDIILGPGVNIMRTPLNGRNFEYMTEDPYLASVMAVGYIHGVQSQGVAACVKHFFANNQEQDRGSVNVEMSNRALNEIYLPAFKAAVTDGGVYTLMGSYNKFRGHHCTHNDTLINKILKKNWGFKGIVISDWGAVHNTNEALLNGCDIEMGTEFSQGPKPDYAKFFLGDTVIALVKSGKIPVSVVDDKVRRILYVMYKTNMFDKRASGAFNTKDHQAVTLKIAEEGIVLLKNETILPLDQAKIKNIAVIGENAKRKQAGGGGSSQVKAKYEITPLEGLQKLAGTSLNITYSQGYEVNRNYKENPDLIVDAVKAASKADIAIVVGGFIHGYSDDWNDNAYDAEAQDKKDMKLPFGQDKLIEAVVKANPNTIVVLIGGGPVEMSSWVNQVKGIVQAWYPGMEGGNALANILFGKINPSGKLPVTFPKKLEDSPAHAIGDYPGINLNEHYKEDIFVGYRYFETYKITPEFCFGHGLSYTSFAFSGMKSILNGNDINVSLKITNTGKRDGAEVVQLYVKHNASKIVRSDKELKGFQKVFLKAGESKVLSLTIKKDAIRYFDENQNTWILEPGKYTIEAGNSSRNILVTNDIIF